MVAVSAPGTSHQTLGTPLGTPCQDAHALRVLPGGELVVAVADGAGSAARSGEGAQRAVESMTTALVATLEESLPQIEDEWQAVVVEAFGRTREALVAFAAEEHEDVRAFATTLTCAIATDTWLVVGQIGDGAVVATDATGALCTGRCDPDEENLPMPPTSSRWTTPCASWMCRPSRST